MQMTKREQEKTIQTKALPMERLLIGEGWVHYIKQSPVTIGRSPRTDDTIMQSANEACTERIDVCIGNMKTISRRHIQLNYEKECDQWSIKCLSKNGVHINGIFYTKPASFIPLESK